MKNHTIVPELGTLRGAIFLIVVALALLLAFGPLGLANTFAGLVAAQAMLGVPFVVVTVLASLSLSS